jgi:hypothetical protein
MHDGIIALYDATMLDVKALIALDALIIAAQRLLDALPQNRARQSLPRMGIRSAHHVW